MLSICFVFTNCLDLPNKYQYYGISNLKWKVNWDISIQIIWIIYLLHEIWGWSHVEQLGFLFADKTILVQYSFKIPLVKKISKFQHVIRKWPFYFCWQKWRKATIIVSQNCHKQCHKQQISSPFYATKFFFWEYWIHSLAAL